MHWIQAIVSSPEVLKLSLAHLPSAVICQLEQGLALIPITNGVEADLGRFDPDSIQDVVPHSGELARGVAKIASQLSMHAPVLYIATYIHGGTGGQDAIIWRNGQVALSIGDDEEAMSAWPDSPISRALRHVGVAAQSGQDEFDAIGLGRFRSNQSWAAAYASA